MIFFLLCLVSIVEVFSASSFLTYKGGSYWGPLIKHTFYILMGMGAMIVVLNIPCKYFKIATFPLLLLSSLMLFGVLIIGQATNGAARWVNLGFVQFQPSEIGKGALVLAVAQILSALRTETGTSRQAFWWVLGSCGFIILPILFENFSTAMLISIVIFLMMVVANVPKDMLLKLAGVVVLGIFFVLAAVMLIGKDNNAQPKEEVVTIEQVEDEEASEMEKRGGLFHRFDTWKSRIVKFADGNDVVPDSFDLDKDAQVAHANIAIMKSNGIGRGPGNSQERDFLSQAFSDFIFAIIIEEMGIVGAAVIAALYVILFWRAGRIASTCVNSFPAYLAMGIGLLLIVQAMFNMMVAVGLAPVTGQPLPLISKGGTSTIINCVYIGMLLSVSKSAKKKQEAVASSK